MPQFHGSLLVNALLKATRRFEARLPANSNQFIHASWYNAAPGHAHGPVWGKCEIMEANDDHSRIVKLVSNPFLRRNIVAETSRRLCKRVLIQTGSDSCRVCGFCHE